MPAAAVTAARWSEALDLTFFFGVLGGLLVLAFLANLLARKTGIPDVLVLMATGVLLGPVLHLIDLTRYPGLQAGFGTLALILVLLEAGLDLDLRQFLKYLPVGILLATVSYALCLLLIAPVTHRLLGLSWRDAILVAAVLGGVSASVSLPVLQTLQMRTSLRMILTVEGAMADIFSVLTVTSLLHAPQGTVPVGSLLGGLAMKLSISLALGIAVGAGWAVLLPRLSDRSFWQVLTFGAVLVLFAVTEVAGGADLLAVLIFGLSLANLPLARRYLASGNVWQLRYVKPPEEQTQLLAFNAELSFLVRTFFFVLAGMDIEFSGFATEWKPIVAVVLVVLLARWFSILATRLLWRDSHPLERELAFWMHPRGLITVVLALRVVNVRGASMNFLVDMAFALVLLNGLGMTVGTVRGQRLATLPELQEEPAAPGLSNPQG
jgi:cell volume regulation protein A